MARVNITIPDGIVQMAKDADLNISRIARNAIVAELDRLSKIAGLERDLAELEAELGPINPADRARADAFLDQALGPADGRRTA